MKKLCFLSMVLFATISIKAQSLEDIGKMINKQQYATARVAIDKFIVDPKNAASSDAWYYKGLIYNSLSRDTTVAKADALAYKQFSFDAFKKNQQLDKMDLRMKTEFFKSYLDLYLGYYDLGAQNFNSKNYVAAYNAFSKAQDIENFILSKNYLYDEFKFSKLDTGLIMIIAASAERAGDTANTILNYRRITDAGVTGPDYESVYDYLSRYYLQKGANADLQNIVSKGKAAYPKNTLWNAIELEQLAKSGDKNALFARYEELYNTDPKNFANSFNYSIEMYNSLWANNNTPDTTLYLKLTQVLKSAIEVDETMDATMLLNNHLFNVAADYSTKSSLINVIKTTKPDELKRKKDLNSSSIKYMNEFIPYGEKMIKYFSEKGAAITTKQKVNYKQVATYLSDAYRVKGDVKKSAEYDKIIDSIKF